MMQTIKARERHFSNFGWLKTYWLFSFSDYFDASNVEFGNIRVFNDDIVEPKGGFPNHQHDNMEILTIVLEGELTHTDSMGHESKVKTHDVQVMSAGSGITHAEENKGDTPVHLFQIWLYPKQQNLASRYEQKSMPALNSNTLTALSSGKNIPGALRLYSDASVYWGKVEKGNILECALQKTHGIFLYVIRGKIRVNESELAAGDQARIQEENSLRIIGEEDADFILIDTHMKFETLKH